MLPCGPGTREKCFCSGLTRASAPHRFLLFCAMKTSIFDIFKIGIGPSSSHTVGPMRAAGRFVRELDSGNLLGSVVRVLSELFGSLALTGVGHGTDRAVLLGLSGEVPDEIETSAIDAASA